MPVYRLGSTNNNWKETALNAFNTVSGSVVPRSETFFSSEVAVPSLQPPAETGAGTAGHQLGRSTSICNLNFAGVANYLILNVSFGIKFPQWASTDDLSFYASSNYNFANLIARLQVKGA